MGAKNSGIRQIFLYHSAFLILKGLFWGNVIGLGLIFLQYYTHILPLDASMYYISYVPVLISWPFFVAINIGTFIISTLILVVPSQLITKISPAKSIRFE
jgi:lipoprotein-releasing system permease protein